MRPTDPVTPSQAAADRPAEPEPAGFEGWHDSSLELRRGLVVTEHGPLDPLAEALALPGGLGAESLTQWIRPRAGAGR